MRSDPTGSQDLFLGIMAAFLLLTGTVMLFTDLSAALAFSFIAVGAALTAVSARNRRDDRPSH